MPMLTVAVWNSGILLFRLLDALNGRFPGLLRDKTVMELGCGAGLSSIAASRLGARRVVATDANAEVLELARRNVERNIDRGGGGGGDVGSGEPAVTTASLQWGIMDAAEYEGVAEVVIGSDLTYNSGSWLALSETMATILKPGGIVIYLVS